MKKSTQSFLIALISIVILNSQLRAQTNIFPSTGAAGIGTLTPNASSLLDISSTTKGILIPRMTQAQRDAIVGPATGLMIYQTTNTPGFYYYSGTAWTAVSKGANTVLSNLKAPTAVNQSLLPGTSNSIDLGSSSQQWRNAYFSGDALIHGITIGLGAGNFPYNLAVGVQTLHANTVGYYNTAIGTWTLYNNTVGGWNTAIGYGPLFSNTTGTANTAIGLKALYYNTEGSGNTANGCNALLSNTSGYSNVAMGAAALYSNTTQSNLVAVGDSALRSNATGYANTAIGSKSLYSNTTGTGNTANGYQALYSNTTGNDNTANGQQALLHNTGYDNTATGAVGLYYNTTGNFNTVNGAWSLFLNQTGNYNTAIGYYTLLNNSTGSNNTTLGAMSDLSMDNLTNATAIGYGAVVNASNKVRIGNSYVTVVESNAGFWTTSDGRFKNNIKEDVKGLEFIKLLRPVTYNFDTKKFEEMQMQNYPDSMKEKKMQSLKQPFEKSSSVRQTGFVAQEVFEATRKIGYDFNGVHAPENPTDNWSLSYEKLVVPLVKAVQELSSQNEKLKNQNEVQQNINEDLQNRLSKLEEIINSQYSTINNHHTESGGQWAINEKVSLSGAALQQNVPNPFNHTTTINYTLPQTYSSAKIIVTDKAGKVLKQVNLSTSSPTGVPIAIGRKGAGSLNLDASAFASGAYQYSLYVDGKLIDTKQMEHLK